jgi:hypothetical protein
MPLQSEVFDSIEWHKPAAHLDGIVVAAPHESKSPVAAEYALAFSAATGAGLVIDGAPDRIASQQIHSPRLAFRS